MPGADPAIQKWFQALDKAKGAFDQALFEAEQAIATKTAARCQSLSQTATSIDARLPGLRGVSPTAGAAIADTLHPLMTTMLSVADSCTKGDFVAAQTLLTQTAIPQQADAQERIDEILDGDI
jgi:hypothetical protein